jgi:hypothetical protein
MTDDIVLAMFEEIFGDRIHVSTERYGLYAVYFMSKGRIAELLYDPNQNLVKVGFEEPVMPLDDRAIKYLRRISKHGPY